MNHQPLLICFLSFMAGIFTQDIYLLPENLAPFMLGSGLLFLFLLLIRNFYVQKSRSIIIAFFFYIVGVSVHGFQQSQPNIPIFHSQEILVFKMEKKLNSNLKNRRYIVELEKEKEKFKAVISVPRSLPELDFEHVYRGEMNISRPKSPDNDFQFNYARFLERQHIYLQGYLMGPYEIATLKEPDFFQKIRQNRFVLLDKINRTHLSDPVQNFLKGIILADRTEMDEVTVQDFNRSGLVHFLAISGTHVVIIYLMIMTILEFVIPFKLRKIGVLISLLLIWIFALYIGFGSSVVRSCIMISVYYAYVLLQRKTDLLHSLSLSGLIILSVDSQQLFDIGFQLSFFAVFGIFWLNGPLLALLPVVKSYLVRFLLQTTTISISAQLITLPLVLFYFHQFSWMSIPANIIIVPFSEIMIIFSFVITLFYGLGIEVQLISFIYEKITSSLLYIIHIFSAADFAFNTMVPMTLIEAIFVLIIVVFLRSLLLRFRLKNIVVFVGLVMGFATLRSMLNFREENRSEVLKAGNFRDTILIIKNNAEIQLFIHPKMDTAKIRRSIIEPYLTSRRVTRCSVNLWTPSEVVVNGQIYRIRER